MHHGIHRPVVAEFDLRLGGVDVDVDLRRVDVNEEEPRGVVLARHQLVVRFAHRVFQVVAADEAVVHEEVLFTAGALREFRLAHETGHVHEVGVLLHRHQALVVFAAEEVYDALPFVAGRHVVFLVFVLHQLEGDLRMRQGHAVELIQHVLHLHAIALQELATGRYVVEEVAHREGGARCTGHGLLRAHTAAFDQDAHADLLILLAGPELHLRDGRDTGQGFAPEPLGAQGAQVVGLADLAGGVALEAGACIHGAHAPAIVGHLHQGATGILDHQDDARGARIHAVLQQFLHHAGRALHHFAGRDLVGHMVGEQPDQVSHGNGTRRRRRKDGT